jgi:putative ABC transport system permease protein
VATLALGIGANTAIFSVVEGVLLKPLPFPDPDRLTMIWQKSRTGRQLGISELDWGEYRLRTQVFAGLGGFTPATANSVILTGAGNPTEISPVYVTENYFQVIGIKPVIGRAFLPEECLRGRNNFVILSYSFWQSQFGGSTGILSRQLTLNQQKLQVLGVMGPEAYPVDGDVFIPFTKLNPEKPRGRNYHELNIVGRLRPGLTVANAQREMDVLSANLENSYPVTNSGIGAYVLPLRDEVVGNVRQPILMLLSAVGLVLLIACGNAANLLLVRTAARQKEIAIRVAIGAGRSQIMAQFMVECLVLTLAAAGLGLLLAVGLMPLIRALGAQRIPRLQHIDIDSHVLFVTAAIALVMGLLFGLIPVLWKSSANLHQMLREGGRSSRSESGWLRNVLAAGEVALAFVVIVVASLLVRSLNQIQLEPVGFRTDHLLVARLALPRNHYDDAGVFRFYQRLLPKIALISGVRSVSTTTTVPLASTMTPTRFALQGAPVPSAGSYPVTTIASVGANYFETMDMKISDGRSFHPEEIGNLDEVRCIINETIARNYFAGSEPVGRKLLINLAANPPESCEIIGVVGDTRVAGLDSNPEPVLYFAAYVAKDMLVVRTTVDPLTVAPAIRREVAAADPEQPLSAIRTMDQVISQSLSRRSFAVVLLVLFAAVGLILAALGLYGILSYSVAQRTREIGVRMALGAEPAQVLTLILSEGLWVTGIGLFGGVLAALGASYAIRSLLFGVGPTDPLSFVAACVLLLVNAILACLIPAYRATRVDPLTAVRYE